MTPEERAVKVWGEMRGVMACYRIENMEQIAAAIQAAILAERERCAKIAEKYQEINGYADDFFGIAAAIRQGSEGKSK